MVKKGRVEAFMFILYTRIGNVAFFVPLYTFSNFFSYTKVTFNSTLARTPSCSRLFLMYAIPQNARPCF